MPESFVLRHLHWLIVGMSALLNALLWLVVVVVFPRDTTTAILHYNSLIGIDFVGEGQQIMVLPVAALLIVIVNTVLGIAIYRADERAAWLVWSIMPVVQAIFLASFYFIWQQNL